MRIFIRMLLVATFAFICLSFGWTEDVPRTKGCTTCKPGGTRTFNEGACPGPGPEYDGCFRLCKESAVEVYPMGSVLNRIPGMEKLKVTGWGYCGGPAEFANGQRTCLSYVPHFHLGIGNMAVCQAKASYQPPMLLSVPRCRGQCGIVGTTRNLSVMPGCVIAYREAKATDGYGATVNLALGTERCQTAGPADQGCSTKYTSCQCLILNCPDFVGHPEPIEGTRACSWDKEDDGGRCVTPATCASKMNDKPACGMCRCKWYAKCNPECEFGKCSCVEAHNCGYPSCHNP